MKYLLGISLLVLMFVSDVNAGCANGTCSVRSIRPVRTRVVTRFRLFR